MLPYRARLTPHSRATPPITLTRRCSRIFSRTTQAPIPSSAPLSRSLHLRRPTLRMQHARPASPSGRSMRRTCSRPHSCSASSVYSRVAARRICPTSTRPIWATTLTRPRPMRRAQPRTRPSSSVPPTSTPTPRARPAATRLCRRPSPSRRARRADRRPVRRRRPCLHDRRYRAHARRRAEAGVAPHRLRRRSTADVASRVCRPSRRDWR